MQTTARRQGFVAGLRLLPEGLWWLARMRKVWLVILVSAILSSYSRLGIRRLGDQTQASFGKTVSVIVQTRYQWYWTHPRHPEYAVRQALLGVQRPLSGRFQILQQPVSAFADAIFGSQDPHEAPRGPRLSFEILTLNLLYAALTAGLLGWVKLALEREPLSLRAFGQFLGKATGPIWCWFLLLDALRLIVNGLGPRLEHTRFTGESLEAVVLLLLLPFAFFPSVVVAWGKSVVTAFPASLRVFASRGAMVLAFLIVFRIVAEALLILSNALQHYGKLAVDSPLGRFGCYLLADLGSAIVSLLLCTALLLIVLRAEPAPQLAEAVPA